MSESPMLFPVVMLLWNTIVNLVGSSIIIIILKVDVAS